jgi:mannosidase alpha-like ER degradation enhancer 2
MTHPPRGLLLQMVSRSVLSARTRRPAQVLKPVAVVALVAVTAVLACARLEPRLSTSAQMGAEQTRERVRAAFRHGWNAYKAYAWGHDFLKPLSKDAKDWYGVSLNITPIDTLDTLLVMGERDEADRTRRFILETTSFDKDVFVKNFEITIRLLGGLLSSYQLTGDEGLLKLADDLGRRLLPAFDSPTGMPYMFVNLKTGAVKEPNTNPAEIGTLLLEFGTLSKLTGKPVYYEKARRALVALYTRRSAIGLVGEGINCETGAWTNLTSHISGAIDSYYEYLLKASLLFGDEELRRMYDASIAAVNRYLSDERGGQLWYAHADMNTGNRLATHYGALDAFLPAVLALGGDMDRARRLQDSGHMMWTRFGIEPERFDYRTGAVVDSGYPLRPEIIESAYYLYFYTRNQKYRDMGVIYLDALDRWCRQRVGYAALDDVESKKPRDDMDSFFLTETLKYLYLLFSPPETLDLKQVIFTTEAHPLRRTW